MVGCAVWATHSRKAAGWTAWSGRLLAVLCGQVGSLSGLCNHLLSGEVADYVPWQGGAPGWIMWLVRAVEWALQLFQVGWGLQAVPPDWMLLTGLCLGGTAGSALKSVRAAGWTLQSGRLLTVLCLLVQVTGWPLLKRDFYLYPAVWWRLCSMMRQGCCPGSHCVGHWLNSLSRFCRLCSATESVLG